MDTSSPLEKEKNDSCLLNAFALGKFVLNSGVLLNTRSKISEFQSRRESGQEIKTYQEGNLTTVVFAENENLSPFLCSEKIFPLSVHMLVSELFNSDYKNELTVLKSKLLELLECKKKHVIITGAGLGGTVASLFTLWLLETINPKLSRPLCITFGSPLIGDASLQKFVENSVRNSCFLHVAEVAQTRIKSDLFKPFGTFLICYGSEYCLCIEDTEAVMELLLTGGVNTNTSPVDLRDYGVILERLDQSVMTDDDSRLMMIPDDIVKQMVERAENKTERLGKAKRLLNEIKISMAYMEWYKKECKKHNICYYDRVKNPNSSPNKVFDSKIEYGRLKLNDYWKSVVKDVENRPQSDTAILTRRFLFSGYNYMRMVEPLDIAEYYLSGKNEYRTLGRSRHYVMLERWFKAEKLEPVRHENEDLSDLLTFDPCFWARVEESLIVINSLRTAVGVRDKEVLTEELMVFEEYVWGMIRKREVSPEIFLEKSSFMTWWKEYKEIKGYNSPPSDFTEYMNTWKYESYGLSQ